jgi:acetyl-CoA synthase
MVEEPVKALAQAAIEGAEKIVKEASRELEKFLSRNKNLRFSETFLPINFGLRGQKIEKPSDLREVVGEAKRLLPQTKVSDSLWLPYLGDALNAGMSTLFAEEVVEMLKVWQGLTQPLDESFVEKVYSLLTDGSVEGLVAVIGSAPSAKKAEELLGLLKQKKLFAFFIGLSGKSVIKQVEGNVGTSDAEDYLLSLSDEISGMAQFLGLLVQIALRWGNVKPGEARKLLSYIKNEIFAFIIVLGELTPPKAANIAGAISFGVQSVGQVYIPQLLPIHSLP